MKTSGKGYESHQTPDGMYVELTEQKKGCLLQICFALE